VAKDNADLIAAIHTAAQAVREAEQALAQRRAEYRRALEAAYASGISLSALARELGVTRQRVKRIIDGN
jgi:DNA-directed RNA polymerase specialized sigma24 family protein